MKDKNHLAKLTLAGLLVAANLPAGAQADALDSKVVYLAVAGCASHGCASSSQNPPTQTRPSGTNANMNSGANANQQPQNSMNANPNQSQNANQPANNPTSSNWDAPRR